MIATVLGNLRNTVIAGFVLAFLIFLLYLTQAEFNTFVFWPFLARWAHIGSGIMWIGLLWYFNFVQIPSMPKIPDEQKPAIGKVIAPAALFWFRWAALSTVVTGLLLAGLNGYIGALFTFARPFTAIAIGMWLGLIMAFNVWFIIWPNQKKALGIVAVDPAAKAKAARIGMLTSRFNTMFSIPMLFCMVAQQNAGL